MDFYYGMFCGACFFVCLFLAYRIGQRYEPNVVDLRGKPMKKDEYEQERKKAEVLREEEHRKAERMRDGFNQLMSYDVTTATKGKKVVH